MTNDAVSTKKASVVMVKIKVAIDRLPSCVRFLPQKKKVSRPLVDMRPGVEVLKSTPCVSLNFLFVDLEKEGYRAVNVGYDREKEMLRIDFALTPSGKWDGILLEILKMTCVATWRVQEYRNPFFKDDVEVEGENALSINVAGRDPLLENDGSPRLVKRRDEKGGVTKVPLDTKFYLRFNGEGCFLEAVS